MVPRDDDPPSLVHGLLQGGFLDSDAFRVDSGELHITRDPLAGLGLSTDLSGKVLVGETAPPEQSQLGPFELRAVLGRGGMGVVYRAFDREAGRDVALKVVLDQGVADTRLARFRREGEVTAALKHPGILGIHSAGDFDGLPYIAYEMIEQHQTLDEAFEELDLEDRVSLLLEACRALGYAHEQGVLHRDIKPENILLDGEGRVRVADFGLALARDKERLTETGAFMGTPYFMAPEQFDGKRAELGPHTDVWSLGVILYLALTDAYPFDGGTMIELGAKIVLGDPVAPRELNPDVSPGLEAVCLRCLRAEPGERYPDAGALADDLDLALAGGDLSSRRRAPLALVAVCALLLVTGAAAHLLRDEGAPSSATQEAGGARLVLRAPAPGARVYDEAVQLRGSVAGVPDAAAVVVRVRAGERVLRTRARPDGTFQLRVPLAIGTNTLRVEAKGAGAVEERVVVRLKLPAWWKAVDAKPALPLPAGVAFGKSRGEYVHAKDGSVLVWVPPGSFQMGTEQYISNSESPAHRVTLQRGYFIGKYEVSWAQYRKFCAESGRRLPNRSYPVTEAHPVHGVSWFDAQAYCAWAGLRLPREAEWEYAAKGPEGRLYPWGKGFPRPELANYGRRHDTRPVREYPEGRGPFGTLQMAGNLWEWTGDWFATYPQAPQVDPRGWSQYDAAQKGRARRDRQDALRKVVRGGSFDVEDEAKETMLRTVHRDCWPPASRRKDTGFRVVRGLDTPAGLARPLRWTVRQFRFPPTRPQTAPTPRVWRAHAERPGVESTAPRLQLRFGMGGPAGLGASDHFGTIATAQVTLAPGRWGLSTLSDDGVRVSVDGKVVLERWSYHQAECDEATFAVAKERTVTIQVEHFELDGAAILLVELHPAR